MKLHSGMLSALGLVLVASAAVAQVQVDPKLPEYKQVKGVTGAVKSVGSDTMNNLMTAWAEGFKKMYPNVSVEIEGKGSTTAPPALKDGMANFGPMSREMKSSEIDVFEKKHGYKPVGLATAIDMLAVYVNKDNALKGLSLAEVDAVFSKTRKLGYAKDVVAWGELGLTGDWVQRPISLYGRNSASGTYGYFKEIALAKGDFKETVKEQPGSASVVQGVTEDRFGIGYSGIGYRTSGVKPLALSEKGDVYFTTNAEDVLSGKYPISRYLYVYYNAAPGKPVDPLVREFLRYVESREGQETVVKDGYLPIPGKVATEELAKLQ